MRSAYHHAQLTFALYSFILLLCRTHSVSPEHCLQQIESELFASTIIYTNHCTEYSGHFIFILSSKRVAASHPRMPFLRRRIFFILSSYFLFHKLDYSFSRFLLHKSICINDYLNLVKNIFLQPRFRIRVVDRQTEPPGLHARTDCWMF